LRLCNAALVLAPGAAKAVAALLLDICCGGLLYACSFGAPPAHLVDAC
jgi:hypothetical protein